MDPLTYYLLTKKIYHKLYGRATIGTIILATFSNFDRIAVKIIHKNKYKSSITCRDISLLGHHK